jgi:pre-mRNA-splicing helicase BRR2
VIAQKKTQLLTRLFPKKKVARTFEDLTKDAQVLATADLIVTTAQAWDVLSRKWNKRKGFSDVKLLVIDNLHLLTEGGSTLEVVISRMRFISSETNGGCRLICLSSSLADFREVAEWIGAPPENTFNFHPSVRPNSVEVVFHTFDQPFRESRLHMMQKQLMQSILHYNRSTLVVVNDKKQARITALDLVSELSG